jgi:flagellar motor switch protein FliM
MQQWAMNLAEVSELQVGDVLPLEMGEPVVAAIGSRGCFRGQVAEHQGHLVFQVTDV